MEAGVPLRRSLEILSNKTTPSRRALLSKLAHEIDNGATFAEALEAQGRTFPLLYRRMVRVGEISGGLEEVFKSLAEYYEVVRSMWLGFWKRMMLPIIEYGAFALVMSIIRYVIVMLVEKGPDPGTAALQTLLFFTSLPLAVIAIYLFLTHVLRGRYLVHRAIMGIPVIGNIFRAFALWHFCWCMHLMMDAGVPIFDAISWSSEATANRVFMSKAAGMCKDLRDGLELHEAMDRTNLFSAEVLEMVHVGEASGSAPDLFRRLAKLYQERAEFAMNTLSTVVAWMFYLTVIGIIVFYIFKFLGMYLAAVNTALAG